jgi:hypothetical protein
MRKSLWVLMAVFTLVVFAGVAQAAITINFEEGVGIDRTPINAQYTGITFVGATSGLPWLYLDSTTGSYNVSSWPSGAGGGGYWINDLAAAWTGESGPDGKIAFNNADATFFQVNYCSYSQFYLEAYDSSGNLVDSTSGPANYAGPDGPGTLTVNAPDGASIAYVMLHDTGNYWVVDNVVTDATGITPTVPEPATIVIWSLLGAVAYGWSRRRKAA